MSAIDVCYCILILSGSFALVSLGLLLIKSSSAIHEVTLLAQMLEITITKVNHILDDVNNKLEMLNAPVDLVSGIFSRGSMKAGLLSGVGFLSSMFRKKRKKGE